MAAAVAADREPSGGRSGKGDRSGGVAPAGRLPSVAATRGRQRQDERGDTGGRGGQSGGRGRGGRDRSDSGEKGLGGDRVAGRQAVREALAGPRRVREVLLAADLDPAPILEEITELAAADGVRINRVGRSEIEAEAHTDAPQGVVARLDPLEPKDAEVLARRTVEGRPPFLVVLDGVTDPGNLGAVLRSAEGAGATGVVLPRHRTARVTATVAKTAAGAIEHLPIATVGGVPAALSRFRELGVWVVGLDQDGDSSLVGPGRRRRADRAGARGRGQGAQPPGPGTVRRGGGSAAAGPPRLAQRQCRRRGGLLRGRPPPRRLTPVRWSAHRRSPVRPRGRCARQGSPSRPGSGGLSGSRRPRSTWRHRVDERRGPWPRRRRSGDGRREVPAPPRVSSRPAWSPTSAARRQHGRERPGHGAVTSTSPTSSREYA